MFYFGSGAICLQGEGGVYGLYCSHPPDGGQYVLTSGHRTCALGMGNTTYFDTDTIPILLKASIVNIDTDMKLLN